MVKENKSIEMNRQYEILCREVETAAKIKASTPKDFELLSEAISKRTGILLSPTTLKRIWGYLDENVTPRRSTLDTLSRFCGWRDYEQFLAGTTPDIESGNVGGKVIRAGENIRRGERVKLFWHPSRVCIIEYIKDMDWKVVASEGTRLKTGDTFRCPLIISGEPLYLDNLVHDDVPAGVYVCGSKSGITFKTLDPDEKD